MRLVFLGSGIFACPTLRWLAQSEHELACVITQPARGAGRGRHKTRTPVAALGAELGLEVLEIEDVNEPSVVDRLGATNAQAAVVIAFGQKLGAGLIDLLPGGFLNLHASLLPKYRGAAPINWAIARGEERSGCTVFRIVEGMDAGPILTTRWTYIKPEETAGELHDRLAGVGVDAMEAALAMFDAGAIPPGDPQDDTQATPAPKLKKADGVIDWHCSARDVVNHIHAMTPWPSAKTRFESGDGRFEDVTVLRARIVPASLGSATSENAESSQSGAESEPATASSTEAQAAADPGMIDPRRFVAARDGYVELLEVKPSSSRVMTWPEYVNGRHVRAGDRFGSRGGA